MKRLKNFKAKNAYKGKICVLTAEFIFGSAMSFAMVLKDNNRYTIVGKPFGNVTEAYGITVDFQPLNPLNPIFAPQIIFELRGR